MEWLKEFGKLAKTNNSIIIPSNLSDIAGMIKAAASVIKDQTEVKGQSQLRRKLKEISPPYGYQISKHCG